MQLWSRLIEKCGLYCANNVKNSNFQYFRGNNSGVTGRILLTIELIRDLVPINTSCKFGPDWLRNVVSIALTWKEHGRWMNCHDISPSGLRPVEPIKLDHGKSASTWCGLDAIDWCFWMFINGSWMLFRQARKKTKATIKEHSHPKSPRVQVSERNIQMQFYIHMHICSSIHYERIWFGLK